MANASAKARKPQNCSCAGNLERVEPLQVEAVGAGRRVVQIRQRQNRQQHQHAAGHRVENELHRRVDAALVAPDADQEVHRDQHRVPEDVEQEQVERDEHADHRALEQQHADAERFRLLVHRFPGTEQRERGEKAGQDEQQQADAVDADEIADPEGGDPVVALDELKVRRHGVEPAPEQQRFREDQHRDGQRDVAHQLLVVLVVPHEEQHDGAGDRQGDERRQDGERHGRLLALRTREDTRGIGSMPPCRMSLHYATRSTPLSPPPPASPMRRRPGPIRSASAAAARCRRTRCRRRRSPTRR